VIGAILRAWDNFRGIGEASVSVPPMDGALRPNQRLEEAVAVIATPTPDNLASRGGGVWFSSGKAVFELDRAAGRCAEVHRFDHAVTALACSNETLAIGLDSGRVVFRGGADDGREIANLAGRPLLCPTALMFKPSGELLIAQGSAMRPAREWKHDAMDRNASGSIWEFEPASGKAVLRADRLSWPYGLAIARDGAIAFSESWLHRIAVIGPGGAITPVLEDIPGYPARLAPGSDGGYWLAVFAPRNQLIEFVQRERKFRRRMMAEVDPEYWLAPTLKPSESFLEPLQGGAQKHLNRLKPWAPTRSYGLVVRLDRDFQPVESFHSRADGRRHGVTSCIDVGGEILAATQGGNAIVSLGHSTGQPTLANGGE
jgi:hypothetical protein